MKSRLGERQRGNTAIGLIVGLVVGLGVALGIAVYVTKVPVPFMNKTQRGGAEQDEAEARKNRDWNPNGPLAGKAGQRTPAVPSSPTQPASVGPLNPGATASAPTTATPAVPAAVPSTARTTRAPVPVEAARTPPAASASSDPLGDLARARSGTAVASSDGGSGAASGADPFMYFVQAGAYRTTDDAESQRAKLSLMGVEARVTEREQAGRTVYRVRAGPFNRKDEADRLKERLDSGGLESNLVRVQR